MSDQSPGSNVPIIAGEGHQWEMRFFEKSRFSWNGAGTMRPPDAREHWGGFPSTRGPKTRVRLPRQQHVGSPFVGKAEAYPLVVGNGTHY